jgi:hypothetical protein
LGGVGARVAAELRRGREIRSSCEGEQGSCWADKGVIFFGGGGGVAIEDLMGYITHDVEMSEVMPLCTVYGEVTICSEQQFWARFVNTEPYLISWMLHTA